MSFLLDTCVVSEPTRPRPDARVATWMDANDALPMYLSVLSVGELWQGIARQPDPARARALEAWLRDKLLPRFEGRILEFDLRVARAWGELRGQSIRQGRTPPVLDSMLSATAHAHGLTLVTRNTEDFASLGVEVLNPWSDTTK